MKITTSKALKTINSEHCVPITDEDVQKIHEVLLNMLDDIMDVCSTHQIRFALCGGSALGAVRHKGFIPWDDDMDICMPRADYERFIPLFREKYQEKYWIHTPEETSDYALLMAKIRRKGTIYRTRDDFGSDECGLPIDIFIVENTYDFKPMRLLQGIGSYYYGMALSCRKFYRDQNDLLTLAEGNPDLAKVIKIKARLGRILALFGSVDHWRLRAVKNASKCKNENSKYVTTPSGTLRFFKETFLRTDYLEYRVEEFEGRRINIPIHEEMFFERCYGDWKRIPDASEIEQHSVIEFKI